MNGNGAADDKRAAAPACHGVFSLQIVQDAGAVHQREMDAGFCLLGEIFFCLGNELNQLGRGGAVKLLLPICRSGIQKPAFLLQ